MNQEIEIEKLRLALQLHEQSTAALISKLAEALVKIRELEAAAKPKPNE